MEFRKDIQGLRGIAAILVILFHINKNILSGMFTGVDMFFVISGFIISLGVYYKLEDGTYSLTSFYARRIKRLMPAMFLLIIMVMLLCYYLVIANDAIKFLKQAQYTLLFGANFFNTYNLTSGYFDAKAAQYPLLHMWSLAIEEQFYIIFALLMLLLSFFKSSARAVISSPFFIILALITTFSFAYAEIYNHGKNINFVYYMLPARMGEITMGIIIASLTFRLRDKEYKKFSLIISTLGIALILYSVIYISKKNPFPGINALYPCLGTALIILGGSFHKKNILNRIIGNPITSFFGLISYSMYLYHFAIIAILHYWKIKITTDIGIYIFLGTILLSTISYFAVERPVRKLRISNFKVFVILFLTPLILLLWAIQKEKDYLTQIHKNWEKSQGFQNVELFNKDNQNRNLPESYRYYKPDNVWRSGKKTGVGRTRVLLTSNSLAAQFYPILDAIAKQKGFSFNTILLFGCPGIPNNARGYNKNLWRKRCPPYAKILTKIFPTYDIIIIAHANVNYSNTKGKVIDNMLKKLDEQNKKVILVAEPLIQNSASPMACVYAAKYNNFDIKKCFHSFQYKKLKGNLNAQKLANKYKNVYYYDPYSNNLCPNIKTCYNYDRKTKRMLFRDNNHISRYASLKVAKMELENAKNKKVSKENPLLRIPVWLHQTKKR